MSLIRSYYDPSAEFDILFDNAFLNRFPSTGTRAHRTRTSGFQPKMDIHEDAKSNRVTATFELPGLNKGDVNIDLHNNRLTIAGETKTSSDREENGYAVRERSYGAFSRTLQVPAGIKPEEVKASMENGVLAVTFPKVTSEQAPKKITVA